MLYNYKSNSIQFFNYLKTNYNKFSKNEYKKVEIILHRIYYFNTIDILCDKLDIYDYEYDEYGIDWNTFSEIILYYSNIILEKQILYQINNKNDDII